MDKKTSLILGILLVIVIFLFDWTTISKDLKHVKNSNKIILDEKNFIKSFKKAVIITHIVLGIIASLGMLDILTGIKFKLTVAIYFLIEGNIYSTIRRKYIKDNLTKD